MSIRDAVLKEIERGTLHQTSDNTAALRALVDTKIVTVDALCGAVNVLFRKYGRLCYEQHVRSISGNVCMVFPDHTLYPPAFAYALDRGVFDAKEQARIRFDHGGTKESFVSEHRVDTLCQRIVEGWLDTTPPPEHKPSDSDMDDHCCCSH